MDVRVFQEWLEAMGRAWEGRDPEAAARLFTEDATYQETPFVEPMKGRAAIRTYWEEVPRSQDQIQFQWEVLAFARDGEGLARWRTSFVRIPSAVRVELDGILLVRLVEDGRCAEFREWWHRREGVPARSVDPTEQLVVELSVRDLTRSVTFYRALGFDLLRGEERFAVLAWEGHQLFLQQGDHLPTPPATAVINLRVMVPDVDPLWQRATELGPRVIVPIGDRHYGLRDFTIADPDGYELRFATRLRAGG
jgi:uncharacterized protein (TIGR02246 family)